MPARRVRGRLAVGLPVAGAVLAAAVACSSFSTSPAAAAVPTSTAAVVRTDVASRQVVNGTIGYGASVTISAPAGASPQAVAQAQAAVDQAAAQLSGARQGVADAQAVAAQQLEAAEAAVASAQATVSADQQRSDQQALARDQAALASAQAQLAAVGAGNRQHVDQAQAALTAAQAQLASAQRSLEPVAQTALVDGTAYTWLPALGSVVDRGQRLYEVAGRLVPLFLGDRPAWRRLAPGVSGPDVKQLEENLLALGFGGDSGLVADGNYTGADAAAVRSWQAALGVVQTGLVDLGAVVFMPAPVRVSVLRAAVGGAAQGGAAIMDVTSTQRVVTVALDTAYEQFVKAGDGVTITLPDNRTTAGTVADVGSVASAPSAAGQGNQGGPQQRPTVAVTVGVTNQQALARYDQAPVRVSITDALHRGVLAVPVVALLAQPGGSYAVRVMNRPGGTLVGVVPGLFGDGGQVEVTGQGLVEGARVQVPQT